MAVRSIIEATSDFFFSINGGDNYMILFGFGDRFVFEFCRYILMSLKYIYVMYLILVFEIFIKIFLI